MVPQFSKVSVDFTKKKTKKFLKTHGIFFTPKTHRDELLKQIRPFLRDGIRILEPSVGSGEFVKDLISQYSTLSLHIDAIELNEELFNYVNTLDGCNAILGDFVTRQFVLNEKYDIILGNPPFFELSTKIEGYRLIDWTWNRRTNIYSLFILKSISLLKPGGVLAFIVPPSWLNGNYYKHVRADLNRQGRMLYMADLSNIDRFMKTRQDTMMFVFQKGSSGEDQYKFTINHQIFYSFQKDKILKLMDGATTIKQLRARVRTGPCAWNQIKGQLSDDPSQGIPLIYSNNIQGRQIVLHDRMSRGKKQYVIITNENWLFRHSSIIMNRGFGKRKNYSLEFALCRLPQYTCENHTNVIVSPTEEILQVIYNSLCHPQTQQWCSLFIGNGHLSKTELEEYLPIFPPQ